MGTYPKYSNLYPELREILDSRAENTNKPWSEGGVSGLSTWIRIISTGKSADNDGPGGLVMQSIHNGGSNPQERFENSYGNLDKPGILGYEMDMKTPVGVTGRGLRPSPVVTSFSVEERQAGALKITKFVIKCFTKEQMKRYEKATKSFKDPVFIVSQEEAEKAETTKSTKQKTWHFKAKNVRDYAFATSRKFIYDAMAVDINGRSVMAISLYSKEGNPLWEEHSTRVVANTLEEYSKLTFDYPYSKAISVHAQMGMEYPMICFNYGRPNPDGTYSERLKRGMIGVITHEVGHNFFPMIINSDERQWTWMDEGLNSFVEIIAELDYDPNFITGNLPKDIVPYMGGDQNFISPIMSQGDYVHKFGPNAYTKPAAALYMLRETIMGRELFDYAFRTYSQRWMFKHPTPADFFRTMEDASAMDLDWFWRGWFYTTDYTDIGVKGVKQYYLTDQPTEAAKKTAKRYNMDLATYKDKLVYYAEIEEGKKPENAKSVSDFKFLTDYIEELPEEEKARLKDAPKYFYEVTFEKPGGLVMPIILEIAYEDGTKERKTFPAQIWRYNEKEVKKVFRTDKAITGFTIDPDLETADVDTSNNAWPKKVEVNSFDKFKQKVKG